MRKRRREKRRVGNRGPNGRKKKIKRKKEC